VSPTDARIADARSVLLDLLATVAYAHSPEQNFGLASAGHSGVQVLAIVDRESGGLEAIRPQVGASVPVDALLRLSEVHAAWEARTPSNPSRCAG
jgi:hypothetical protein